MADLSYLLAKEFAKTMNEKDEEKKNIFLYGTVMDDGSIKLDGAEGLTPATFSVDAKPGDKVLAIIENRTCTVTNNLTQRILRSDNAEIMSTEDAATGTYTLGRFNKDEVIIGIAKGNEFDPDVDRYGIFKVNGTSGISIESNKDIKIKTTDKTSAIADRPDITLEAGRDIIAKCRNFEASGNISEKGRNLAAKYSPLLDIQRLVSDPLSISANGYVTGYIDANFAGRDIVGVIGQAVENIATSGGASYCSIYACHKNQGSNRIFYGIRNNRSSEAKVYLSVDVLYTYNWNSSIWN